MPFTWPTSVTSSTRAGSPSSATGESCSRPMSSPSCIWENRPANRLRLGEHFEALDAALPPHARLLVAAERGVGAVPDATIQRQRARPDAVGDPLGPLHVARGDRPRKAVDAVVGDRNGVVLVVVADDAEDRAEDLLPGDPHGVVNVSEQRGLDEEAAVEMPRHAASDDDTCALEPA